MLQSQINEICDRAANGDITLNGKPAVINGRLLRFAWVVSLDGKERYEWSWETVNKILQETRNFTTK